MLQRKLRTQNSIKFDVTEFFVIYFFFCCFLQLMLLTKIPTFPTRKMMTSFNGQKFHPFLVFRFALVEPHVWWDDTPVMFVANDIILLSMRIHSDFSGRQKRTFRLLFCRLDSLRIRPLTLSRMNDGIRNTEKCLPAQRVHSVYFSFSRIVCVNLIRMCCTWVNRINASTCNYLCFSVAT